MGGKKTTTTTDTHQQGQSQVTYDPTALGFYQWLAPEKQKALEDYFASVVGAAKPQVPLTQAQLTSIRAAGPSAVNATYGTAAQELMRRSAATGSAAALPEAINELARSRAQQMAATRLQAEAAIPALQLQNIGQFAQLYQPLLAQAVPLIPTGQTYDVTGQGTEVQKQSGGLLGTILGLAQVGAKGLTMI